MKKWWFNSMLSKGKGELEYRCWLSKSMESPGPIKNPSVSEELIRNDKNKNIHNSSDSDSSSYSKLAGVRDIHNFLSDDTFFVKDSNRDSYSIYFDIENQILELDNAHSFLSELESSFYSFRNYSSRNNGSKSADPDSDRYMYDTKSSWNNHIHNCLDSYLHSQICIDSHVLSSSDNYSASYIYNFICSESESSNIQSSTNGSDLTISKSSNGRKKKK